VGVVHVPWGAWYEDTTLALSFPDRFEVYAPPLPESVDMDQEALTRALEEPIDSPPLAELAQGRSSLAVAVDDLTRPTPAYRFLPWILETAQAGGIPLESIVIVVATGAHRPLQRVDLLKKLGPGVLGRVAVFNHSPYQGLEICGNTSSGTPIEINRWFYEADLKVVLGAVLPHPTAGFGGGAKIVMPGLGSIESLLKNHQLAAEGKIFGVGVLEGNPLREDLDEVVTRIGIDFSINVVCPSVGRVAKVFAGHPVRAHRKACLEARRMFIVEPPPFLPNIVCFNSYPKDTEFLQVANAFNVWSDRESPLVAPGGTVVVLTAASEGFGTHGLLGPGGPLYRPLSRRIGLARMFEERSLAVVCPTVSRRELEILFPKGTKLFENWSGCRDFLEKRHKGIARVAVFAASAQQIISRDGDST
jgi:nickel-dependent lactate racemase